MRLPTFVPLLGNFVTPPVSESSTIRTELVPQLSSSVDIFPSSPALAAAAHPGRPALVISSTSWTDDEDFGILIEALRTFEQKARANSQLPKLLMLVTGKGPLRQMYMERVIRLEREEKWQSVRCRSLWLEAADYPLLLGSADFGVSLHSSSSGLDLPMKVVDMFGCGLPVCALNFACLGELIKDGENGLIFSNASELSQQFERLLSGFPNCPDLTEMRSHLEPHRPVGVNGESSTWCSWEENWDAVVRPLITGPTPIAR